MLRHLGTIAYPKRLTLLPLLCYSSTVVTFVSLYIFTFPFWPNFVFSNIPVWTAARECTTLEFLRRYTHLFIL